MAISSSCTCFLFNRVEDGLVLTLLVASDVSCYTHFICYVLVLLTAIFEAA